MSYLKPLPDMPLFLEPGVRLYIPAGTSVNSTHPQRRNWTTRRRQAVTPRGALYAKAGGYEVCWAGTSGYWCYATVPSLETVTRPLHPKG